MRVDLVITELFVGGAERCLTELAIGLTKSGDQVRVFSIGSLPEGEQRAFVDRLQQHGISVESAEADSGRHLLAVYHRLKSWFAESPPDISQSFLYHANVIGTWAARAAGVEVCVGGLRVAESRWLRCALERIAVRRMDSVVCVSRGVERFASQTLQCPAQKTLVIPNGVEVDRFSAAKPLNWSALDWPSDSVVTLYVGRLHPQKGIERIQRQIDRLAPAGSDRRLLIVGDGPLRKELSEWADTIGPQRVRMLGWQPNIEPMMKACRLLLLPSHYEGMPNVALEAMAAGRPVVCSRVEGADELFAHRLSEQTFRPEEDDAMKNLIEPFLDDEVLSDRIGLENLQRVEQMFSIEAMIDGYRQHYRELLAEGRD
ncbi:MAG: glycosyltransferase [Rubripirellula sp.]|nr:glycosyltransferase [Rubripirellula sp.]